MKEISIIMPVYNAEKHLKKTLLSVINQSFEKSFELIIINDGSNDGSKKIIDTYKEKYPELIIVIDKKNSGVSDSRNIGIDRSKGRYITFIDSDDMYKANYLEKLYNSIQNGYDLVSCNYNNFEANSNEICINEEFETSNIGVYLEKLQTHYLFNQLWNKIYKTDIIKENNIKFDVTKSIAEDWEFNVLYLSKCEKMKHINETLYSYRVTGNGLGFKYRNDSNFIKLDILKKTESIFKEKNIKTHYLNKCYIIQIFSFLSVIMDLRNNMNFKEKKNSIRKFILSDDYSKIINNIDMDNFKYRILLFLLKRKNVFVFCLLGIFANKYDKYKKRKNFGI